LAALDGGAARLLLRKRIASGLAHRPEAEKALTNLIAVNAAKSTFALTPM